MPDENLPTDPAPPEGFAPKPYVRPGSPGSPADVIPVQRGGLKPKPVEKPPELKDPVRETVETIVFVVVLVFMLKTFLAEAFVIPTGSMATTLYGYHRDIVCRDCGFPYPVNASNEPSIGEGPRNQYVITSDCPNCGYRNNLR